MKPEQQIRQVLDAYIDATARRDLALMRDIFHDDAAFSGRLGDRDLVCSIYPFFDHLAQNAVYSTYNARIIAVSAARTCGGARLEERELFGTTWDTFLHLVHAPDGWRITAKMSQPR